MGNQDPVFGQLILVDVYQLIFHQFYVCLEFVANCYVNMTRVLDYVTVHITVTIV